MSTLRLTRYFLSAAIAVWTATVTPLFAQQSSAGQVSGHVVDMTGAAISKATVFFRKLSEDGVQLATHSDGDGNFMLILPEGRYDILVTTPGFTTAVQTVAAHNGKVRRTHWKLRFAPCDPADHVCDT